MPGSLGVVQDPMRSQNNLPDGSWGSGDYFLFMASLRGGTTKQSLTVRSLHSARDDDFTKNRQIPELVRECLGIILVS
ncbi:MAG: hypothetical protein JXQ96_18270 [Cyclobacteriaceae bacterium]